MEGWIRKDKDRTHPHKLQYEHYIWCDPQTNKQAPPPPRQLPRPPYDGLLAIRLITFHTKAILYLGSLKECCAGTTVEKQLHLTGTRSIRLELSATQPAWRGAGNSPIKRAVHKGERGRDPAGHYKWIQPPDQTKTKNRTNRPRDERQARPAQPQTDETVTERPQTTSAPSHPPTLPAPSAIQSLPPAAVDIIVSLYHLIQNLDAWRWSKKRSKTQTNRQTNAPTRSVKASVSATDIYCRSDIYVALFLDQPFTQSRSAHQKTTTPNKVRHFG